MKYQRIKSLREDNDKTQQELADYLNISRRNYADIENGNRSLRADMIVQLAKYYDVSSDYLLGLKKNNEN